MAPVKSSTKTKSAPGGRKKTKRKTKPVDGLTAKAAKSSKTVKAPKKTKISVRIVNKKVFSKNSKDEEAVVGTEKTNLPASGREEKTFSARSNKNKLLKDKGAFDEYSKEDNKKVRSSPCLYRNIAFSFLFLTIILLGAVFYLYFVSLTVEIEPRKENFNNKVSFGIIDEKKATGTSESLILGAVESLEVKKEKIYESTGEEVLGHEIIGEVTLINETFEDRPLVATTRLLTPDGKLFRLKNRVTISANGRIKAGIYADEPSSEMAVSPGNFTIPGLWAGLQEKVYAENSAAFVYKQEIKKTVTQSDINKAIDDLKNLLSAEVNDKLGQEYKGFDKVVLKFDNEAVKTEINVEDGDEVENFKVSMSAAVEVVAFSRAAAVNLAEKKFVSSLPSDMKSSSLNEDAMECVLSSADFDKGEALVELSFSGYAVSKKAENSLDKSKLIGLNEAQIREYLEGLNKFSGFKINFWPSFIKKAPMLVDRIKIIVK